MGDARMRGLVADPIFLVLVIGAVGTLMTLRNRIAGCALVGSAFLLLYALSTPLLSKQLLAMAQLPSGALSDPHAEYEEPGAIVVLSAGRHRSAPEYGGDIVDGLGLERLRYAAHEARKTGLPVLVSGGRDRDDEVPLADLMKQVLEEDMQVPVRWVEDRSRNTFENALFSARMLRSENIGSVILVTHAFHMRRAAEAFERVGIHVVPAATVFTLTGTPFELRDLVPQVSSLQSSAYALHELIGLVAYRIIAHLNQKTGTALEPS
jgi:uncharacterized SAM-binding protein YcdF (DUF218 family)